MDCAIGLFGGNGVLSFFLYAIFIVSLLCIIILFHALKESREKIATLQDRIEALEERTQI